VSAGYSFHVTRNTLNWLFSFIFLVMCDIVTELSLTRITVSSPADVWCWLFETLIFELNRSCLFCCHTRLSNHCIPEWRVICKGAHDIQGLESHNLHYINHLKNRAALCCRILVLYHCFTEDGDPEPLRQCIYGPPGWALLFYLNIIT
jgi:hypothetical protein